MCGMPTYASPGPHPAKCEPCKALLAVIEDLRPWRDAVIDAMVVDWVLSAENKDDPRRAINDLICWNIKVALDPAVSKEAARWKHAWETATHDNCTCPVNNKFIVQDGCPVHEHLREEL